MLDIIRICLLLNYIGVDDYLSGGKYMINRSKALSILFVFIFFAISLFPSASIYKNALGSEQDESTFLEVNLDYPTCDLSLNYQFTFYTTEYHETLSWFHIVFPAGTSLSSPIPTDEKDKSSRLRSIHSAILNASKIKFNQCKTKADLPELYFSEDDSLHLRFQITSDIDPMLNEANKIVIIVPHYLGFISPKMEGDYVFQLKSDTEPEWKFSKPIRLNDFDPETNFKKTLDIVVDPPHTGVSANYEFSIYFDKYQGFIQAHFLFPPGSTIQPPLPEDSDARRKRLMEMAHFIFEANRDLHCCSGCLMWPFITINDDTSISFRYDFIVPIDPGDQMWKKVSLFIPEGVGIATPSDPGDYVYKILIHNHPDWRVSKAVTIAKKAE